MTKKEGKKTDKDSPGKDIRHTLFRMSLLGICLLSLVILVSYIITLRPLINTLTMITIIFICLFFYRFSRDQNRYGFARIGLFIMFTFLYVPFGFFTSPGSISSMPYYILFIIFMETLLAVNRWEYAFPLSVMGLHILLLHMELRMPGRFIPFDSESHRILDLSINYTIVAIFMMGITVFVMERYNRHSKMLRSLSITDKLTGLYNRLYLEEEGVKELHRCERTGENLSLMFLDLNNFKRINDHLGHQEGDRVLQEVARIIKENTRDYDLAARIGGDEFVILLPSTTGEMADRQIRRLDDAFRNYSRRYEEMEFSVSFGIAESRDSMTFYELMNLADKRLYRHKARVKKEGEGTLFGTDEP